MQSESYTYNFNWITTFTRLRIVTQYINIALNARWYLVSICRLPSRWPPDVYLIYLFSVLSPCSSFFPRQKVFAPSLQQFAAPHRSNFDTLFSLLSTFIYLTLVIITLVLIWLY